MTREEAKNILTSILHTDGDYMDYLDSEDVEAIKFLANDERPHGEWVKTPKAVMGEGYMWYCDKCGHQVYQDSSRPYPSEKFCPNCGADNRKREGDKK